MAGWRGGVCEGGRNPQRHGRKNAVSGRRGHHRLRGSENWRKDSRRSGGGNDGRRRPLARNQIRGDMGSKRRDQQAPCATSTKASTRRRHLSKRIFAAGTARAYFRLLAVS